MPPTFRLPTQITGTGALIKQGTGTLVLTGCNTYTGTTTISAGTLQIGDNRLIIGLVKRVHVRGELFDPATLRIRSENLHLIGRMASPHWYCRTATPGPARRATNFPMWMARTISNSGSPPGGTAPR